MPILTKEVEVKANSMNIKYYEELGYKIPTKKSTKEYYNRTGKEFCYDLGKTFTVKVNDLQKGSDVKVEVLCDYCHKEILTLKYDQYVRRTKDVNKIACRNCYAQKVKETSLIRYGIDNYAKTKECHEKMKNTMFEKYGVEHNSHLPDYREKFHNTCIKKYGESYNKQFVEMSLKSFYNKTGYKFPSQSPKIREKITQSYIDKYGVDNPSKSPEVRKKTAQTFYQNYSQKTSMQQFYIFNIYKSVDKTVCLNYPISSFNADICFPIEKLDIEYDGGFHDGQVKIGNITQEEFNHKELIRDKVIKSEGYRVIRIKSKFDLLPSDKILLQMLSMAREYFSATYHTWIKFDIDNSVMINAENKDANGIFFDYGELRKIK